jgi:hypothetical protein
MAQSRKTKRKTTGPGGKARRRPAREPSHFDLVRQPDITAPARIRFDCELFVQVTHPDYMPREVIALVKQGQAQLDPIAPCQVGTLILNGFPYTVLGYYTFAAEDAEYDEPPLQANMAEVVARRRQQRRKARKA